MEQQPPSSRSVENKKNRKNAVLLLKNKDTERKAGRKKRNGWVVWVTILSFVASAFLMYITSISLSDLSFIAAFAILAVIVCTGVVCDMCGVAVTRADTKVFHSMAARKVRGGRQGVQMIKNADRVSNLFSDVIGDICGIISGACGALIVVLLVTEQSGFRFTLINLLISSSITAFTVGGKALGKNVAMEKPNMIVYEIGKWISYFQKNNKRNL